MRDTFELPPLKAESIPDTFPGIEILQKRKEEMRNKLQTVIRHSAIAHRLHECQKVWRAAFTKKSTIEADYAQEGPLSPWSQSLPTTLEEKKAFNFIADNTSVLTLLEESMHALFDLCQGSPQNIRLVDTFIDQRISLENSNFFRDKGSPLVVQVRQLHDTYRTMIPGTGNYQTLHMLEQIRQWVQLALFFSRLVELLEAGRLSLPGVRK